MMNHTNCSHAATSSARRTCRKQQTFIVDEVSRALGIPRPANEDHPNYAAMRNVARCELCGSTDPEDVDRFANDGYSLCCNEPIL